MISVNLIIASKYRIGRTRIAMQSENSLITFPYYPDFYEAEY